MTDTPLLAPRVARGFQDNTSSLLHTRGQVLRRIAEVYELYGFEPLDTPTVEYADALGKFLPDQERPNEGVFAFRDDDEQWLSLRYDLTAPLARFVAQNFDQLPKPFRRYQLGNVFRNEKPGPGRFREFMQFDVDTVGTASMSADAELCMILGDVFERLGIPRGDYVVKVNNRKILNGVLEAAGVTTENQRMTALRAIDKLDRLGAQGVRLLLGSGRKDESGDFTAGAGLSGEQADRIIAFTAAGSEDRKKVCATLAELVGKSSVGRTGVDELLEIDAHLTAVGFGPDRVRFDPGIVRGLAYYTGPVLEAELTFQIRNEDGQLVRFGSVAGGGRYDDLVKRFTGNDVPATGVSIGVSRLVAALEARNLAQNLAPRKGPVVVLVMDREASAVADYWRIVAELRDGGIAAELYLGEGGMKAQLKYADKRGAPLVVIEGSNERASKTVTLKNMTLGAEQAKDIKDRETWAKGASAQTTASRADLVSAVRAMLDKGPKA